MAAAACAAMPLRPQGSTLKRRNLDSRPSVARVSSVIHCGTSITSMPWLRFRRRRALMTAVMATYSACPPPAFITACPRSFTMRMMALAMALGSLPWLTFRSVSSCSFRVTPGARAPLKARKAKRLGSSCPMSSVRFMGRKDSSTTRPLVLASLAAALLLAAASSLVLLDSTVGVVEGVVASVSTTYLRATASALTARFSASCDPSMRSAVTKVDDNRLSTFTTAPAASFTEVSLLMVTLLWSLGSLKAAWLADSQAE
mmetsp:Transcript_15174/g.37800  ORF Transcript_15174/g.37800 Transcript_15174/m.37800 type:complete len:258 (+) Transcript_15174:1201-1974(+)